MNTEIEKIAISIKEAARLSGLSVSYLYRLSAEGKLPVSKVGSRCVIVVDDFKAWLRGHIRNGGEK